MSLPEAVYGRCCGSIKCICVCRPLAILPITHFQQCGQAQLFVKALMDQLREVSACTHTNSYSLQGKHSQIDLLNSVLSHSVHCNCVITVRADALLVCVRDVCVYCGQFHEMLCICVANSFQMKEAPHV